MKNHTNLLKRLAVALLALAFMPAAFAQITIDSNPDYRYRDVQGNFIGPGLDLDNFLEVFLNISDFDTRTGLEFPIGQLASCGTVTSASLALNATSRGFNAVGNIDISGFEGTGTPQVANVYPTGTIEASFVPVLGVNTINLPTAFIQAILDGGVATHIGLALSTSVVDNGVIFSDDNDGNGPSPTLTVTCEAAPPATYSVGGTVSGLTGSVTLQNNGADDLVVNAAGAFTFLTELADGATYDVTVSVQPVGQTCSVSNGSGTIAAGDVTNVTVSCTDNPPATFSVGGTVSGLSGSVTLQNNGADDLVVNADGAFTFLTELADGATYDVTVSVQPVGQTCSVSNGSGTIAAGDVTNVTVSCTDNPPATFSIGGAVSGLSGSMTLQNNGGDDLVLNADGAFAFTTELVDGATYSVTVSAQPAGQTCSVSNGAGTVAGADVSNVQVDCADVPPPPTAEPVIPVPVDNPLALALLTLLTLMVGLGYISSRRT